MWPFNKSVSPTFQSRIKAFVDAIKVNDPSCLTQVNGNIVWVSSSGLLRCYRFTKNGYNTFYESQYPPYRSCPQRLIDHAGLNYSNAVWRDSVHDYIKSMNRKLTKGQKYKVVGDSNYDHVVITGVTNTNVVGTCGPHQVKISKLKIGDLVNNQVDVDSLPSSL